MLTFRLWAKNNNITNMVAKNVKCNENDESIAECSAAVMTNDCHSYGDNIWLNCYSGY